MLNYVTLTDGAITNSTNIDERAAINTANAVNQNTNMNLSKNIYKKVFPTVI